MRCCSPAGVHASVDRRVAGEPSPVEAASDEITPDESVSRRLEVGGVGGEGVSLVGVASPVEDDGKAGGSSNRGVTRHGSRSGTCVME